MVLPVSGDWYALFTKGRHEKSVRDALEQRRMEAFLPLRKIRRRWSDRTVSIEEPLFKSYLFVRADRENAVRALGVPGAVRYVSAAGRPLPVRDSVVGALRRIVESEIAADPFPYFANGDRVVVRSGIFQGVEGFVARKDAKRCRLVISIDAMRAAISVEVDSCLVEKL